MSATKVFNLRHLTKYILSFCGLEERIVLRNINTTANKEYNSIIPQLNDVLVLFNDTACYVNDTTDSIIKSYNLPSRIEDTIMKSYLRTRIIISSRCYRYSCIGFQCLIDGAGIFERTLGDYRSIRIRLNDNGIDRMIRNDRNLRVFSYKCSVVNILNYLPIMIKKHKLFTRHPHSVEDATTGLDKDWP